MQPCLYLENVSAFVCGARDYVIVLNMPVTLLSITHQRNGVKAFDAESESDLVWESDWLRFVISFMRFDSEDSILLCFIFAYICAVDVVLYVAR